ncbi:hypothetical protein [Nonomuraea sp. JJY05]
MIRDGQIVPILDHERAVCGDPIMEAGRGHTATTTYNFGRTR